MADLVTLIAPLKNISPSDVSMPLAGYRARRSDRSDLYQLARLYFEAYDAGVACESLEEAIADIEASFGGEYGDFWFEASSVVERGGRIVAAIMTVRVAPWDDTPDCPFIIELFTDRDHRRTGLARHLLARCLGTVEAAGETGLALRVADDNAPALSLYEAIGFVPFAPSAAPND